MLEEVAASRHSKAQLAKGKVQKRHELADGSAHTPSF